MAKTTTKQDDVLATVLPDVPPVEPPANGKDRDGVPYCGTHHVRMVQGSSPAGMKSYYRCPVAGCTGRDCRVKPLALRAVPAEPTKCQRCSTVCERDQRLSRGGKIVLRCPSCEWTAPPLADPGLVAGMARQLTDRNKPAAEILGAR